VLLFSTKNTKTKSLKNESREPNLWVLDYKLQKSYAVKVFINSRLWERNDER